MARPRRRPPWCLRSRRSSTSGCSRCSSSTGRCAHAAGRRSSTGWERSRVSLQTKTSGFSPATCTPRWRAATRSVGALRGRLSRASSGRDRSTRRPRWHSSRAFSAKSSGPRGSPSSWSTFRHRARRDRHLGAQLRRVLRVVERGCPVGVSRFGAQTRARWRSAPCSRSASSSSARSDDFRIP